MKFQYVSKIALAALAISAVAKPALAQVVFTVGAQEIYDSNVFLEDNKPVDTSVLEEAVGEGQLDRDAIRQIDGKRNDDLITNVYIEGQGAIPIPQYVTGSSSAKVGALVFSEASEQSRLTLDAAVEFALADDFRPEYLTLAVGDSLQSGTNSISSAAGTAARVSETNDIYLDLGLGQFDLAPQTTAGVNYRLNRKDFLGEFLFNENKDIPDSSQFKERGSDYVSNSLTGAVNNQLSERVGLGILGGIEHTNFTKIRSNSGIISEDDPDRVDYRGSVTTSYRASEQFVLEGQVGTTFSRFDEERTATIVTVAEQDGSTSEVTITPDRDYTSLTFLGSVIYVPQESSSIRFSVGQDVVTDIDGERTLMRTASINGAHEFNDRLAASAGALFSQYDNAETLSNANDRIELSAGLRYSLTESLALTAGYNYINQSSDSDSSRALSLNSSEYEAHRVFLGISAGFVGLSS